MVRDLRVFIVDDSAVFRQKITKMLEKSITGIIIAGTAPNGKIALEKLSLAKYKTDIILMDILMPEMGGFETIGHIMDRFPTPIIIVSGLTHREVARALTNLGMSAFESGIVEFVKKPNPKDRNDQQRFNRELIKKVQSFAYLSINKLIEGFDIQTYLRDEEESLEPIIVPDRISDRISSQNEDKLIVIGASTGGPRAISLILSNLPPKSPPVIIVQHMPEEMVESWCDRLQKLYPHLNINITEENQFLKPDHVYIAQGGRHCVVEKGKKLQSILGEKVNFVMPAIDVTFTTAAKVYHQNLLGIVLTGMGKDGLKGSHEIKKYGGSVIAEHNSTSIIPSMPNAVIEANLANQVVPLHKISSAIRSSGWL